MKEQVKASTMAEAQRTLLVDLISKWSGIVNDGFAANRLAEIKAVYRRHISPGAGHDA